jgi:hypothetical protein
MPRISVDASEALRRRPDFFLSDEIICVTPSGMEIHVGAYGIEERDHIQLQRRRHDVPALAAYLYERNIFFTVNHMFSSLTGAGTHLYRGDVRTRCPQFSGMTAAGAGADSRRLRQLLEAHPGRSRYWVVAHGRGTVGHGVRAADALDPGDYFSESGQ